jgi:3-phosphoshikimate 1-carboxyvinyltransferase
MEKVILSKKENIKNDISINVPSSKSISNRLLIIKFLSKSDEEIEDLSDSDDTILLSNILDEIKTHKNNCFYTKNAGTTTRFLLALLSITKGNWKIEADKRMNERGLLPLIEVLKSLGADIKINSRDDFFPISICGKELESKEEITFDNSFTSQFVSALLLISPYIKNGLKINIPDNQPSMPYINMTISLINSFNGRIEKKDNQLICNSSQYILHKTKVEKDWSSACFFYGLTSIGKFKNIRINSLQTSYLQGDFIAKDMFSTLGVRTIFDEKGAILSYDDSLLSANEELTFDIKDFPDIFPVLAVACNCINKKVIIKHIENLCFKESNRKDNLIKQSNNFFSLCFISGSNFIIEQHTFDKNLKLKFSSFDDHRLVMAFALIGLIVKEIEIDNYSCVEKSYKDFWKNINNFLNIQVINSK